MLLLFAAVLAFQAQVRTDSVRISADSVERTKTINIGGAYRSAREPARKPVTPELLASAFEDSTARTLLHRARAARMSQDSALMAYDATARERISAWLKISKLGRDRLLFRQEGVSRVRWQRGVGAWVDVKGARVAIPVAPEDEVAEEQESASNDMAGSLPYYPGYEPLISFGSGMARAEVNEHELIHPLAEGSEAYYTYASGDSLSFRLPDRTTVRLRELRVSPREPVWNVVVGSLWFDVSSGQLVRAAYRLAVPMDIWVVAQQDDPHAMDDVPAVVKPLLTPMEAQVSAIAIEYGLYEGRFWLPRMRAAEGRARVSFVYIPFKMEQSYDYASVNGRDTIPTVVVATGIDYDSIPEADRDRVRDSVRTASKARRDSIKEGLLPKPVLQCDTSAYTVSTQYRFGDARIPVAVRTPCDAASLANSPELPPSIYDEGEEVFGSAERDALMAQALSLTAQPHFSPQKPTLHWGAEYLRYNRVEGLSVGAAVEEQFGAGYTGQLLARLGTADLEPNVELSVARTNLVRTLHLTGYNRLVSASDWGNPLSFGSSVSAFLFGRDEGFYYRTSGVELGGSVDQRARLDWRLFVERERSANPETNFSLARVSGVNFGPNIIARTGDFAGFGFRISHTAGEDPRGLRASTDIRLEVATGDDSLYGRGAFDVTVSRALVGDAVGALTLSAGNSVGDVPSQRLWYLGGAQTIRGQSPDIAQSGNAFWMARAEAGRDLRYMRLLGFGDLGWVGDRNQIANVGRPLSGAGIGASVMDGLVRMDLARGFYPRKQWKLNLYVEARF